LVQKKSPAGRAFSLQHFATPQSMRSSFCLPNLITAALAIHFYDALGGTRFLRAEW